MRRNVSWSRFATNDETPLRNPHNSHVGVLARTGWLGAILWVMLWITWMAEMQTLRRRLRSRNRHSRDRLTINLVADADLNRLQFVQDIELGHAQARYAAVDN